jgi:hypothetical protein
MRRIFYVLIVLFIFEHAKTQNVGVGTTNPVAKFTIEGTGSNPSIPGTTSSGVLRIGVGSNEGLDIGKQTSFPFSSWIQSGFNVGPDPLSLQPLGGNLGIGTLSPNAQIQLGNTASNRKIVLYEGVNNDHQFYGLGINTSMLRYQVDATTSNHIFFAGASASSSNEIMRIQGNGNVGIGTPSPTDRLDVNGNIAMRGLGIFEFGKGVVGKEVNAGRVGYNAFGQEGLTFVGGGTTTTNRKVFFFAEGGASFSGNINALTTISVGTPNVPTGYKVAVDGKIIAEELRIQNSTAWPDYVFEKEYDLMPLKDVENHITKHKHLPDVPSAKDVSIDGFAVGDMQKVLLRKIEELTLYIIEQEKRIKELELKIKE